MVGRVGGVPYQEDQGTRFVRCGMWRAGQQPPVQQALPHRPQAHQQGGSSNKCSCSSPRVVTAMTGSARRLPPHPAPHRPPHQLVNPPNRPTDHPKPKSCCHLTRWSPPLHCSTAAPTAAAPTAPVQSLGRGEQGLGGSGTMAHPLICPRRQSEGRPCSLPGRPPWHRPRNRPAPRLSRCCPAWGLPPTPRAHNASAWAPGPAVAPHPISTLARMSRHPAPGAQPPAILRRPCSSSMLEGFRSRCSTQLA